MVPALFAFNLCLLGVFLVPTRPPGCVHTLSEQLELLVLLAFPILQALPALRTASPAVSVRHA